MLINPSGHPDWDRFVTAHPLGTIYHHSSWLNVLRATYPQLSLAAFALVDSANRISSALLFSRRGKRAASLAFTPYCAPLAENEEDLKALLRAVTGLVDVKSASSYELRALDSDSLSCSCLARAGYCDKNHILRLDGGIRKVKESFHPSQVSKAIRKAVKSGVTVRQGSSEADLGAFFDLYARTRKHLGLPIPPFSLFSNMWRAMHPGRLTLFIAEHDRRSIGSLLTLTYNDTLSLEYLGYDKRELSLRGNHLLYFTAIEWACDHGYSVVDFRKTPADNEGLLQFKRRWGTEESDISYFYYPSGPRQDVNGDGALKKKMFAIINRRLPFAVAKGMGQLIYRYSG